MSFNPNTPDTLGAEWFPWVKAATALAGGSIVGAILVDAQANENIDQALVYLSALANVDDGAGSGWELEVYDASNLGSLGRNTTAHVPDSTVFNRDAFAWGAFAPAGTPPGSLNIHQGIDSYPAALFAGKGTWPNNGEPVDNDEFMFPIYGLGCEAGFTFSGVTGTYVGKRITRVKLCAWVQEYVMVGIQNAGCQVTPFLEVGGQRSNADTDTKTGQKAGGHYLEASWWANPVTKASWTATDLNAFAAAPATSCGGWTLNATGSANDLPALLQGWMEVETTDELTDPREAIGVITDTGVQLGWNTIALATPAGAAWAKAAGTTYLVVLRRRVGKATVSWRYLDTPEDVPIVDHVLPADATISPDTGYPSGWSSEDQTKLPTLLLVDTGGSTSADSQPYAHVNGDVVPALGLDDEWTLVNAGASVRQEITTVGADSYTWVRALVALEGAEADDDLTLQLYDGGGVPVGAALVVSPDDLENPRDAFQVVEGEFGGALLAATQYQLRATSGATAGSGWRVQVLSAQLVGSAGGPPADVATPTFAGATDAALVGAAPTRHDELDACLTIATQPAAPADFTAAAVGETDCTDHVDLGWTATALGADFLRYEVERNDDGTWRRIANITTESVEAMEDWEARRNTLCSYRIRVRRADHSASSWTDVATAFPTMGCCGYLFATNVDPSLSTWADDDVEGKREYDLQSDDEVRWFQGRDYPVGFGSLDKRGVSFATSLLLAAEGGQGGTSAATTPGMAVFDRIRAFNPAQSGSGLPYVAVLNQDGDRWFAWCVWDKATRQEPGGAYSIKGTIYEVGVVPYPIDVTP